MIVKNDYNNCLTNLACSVKKYFGLDYNHNTLQSIDKILEEKKPKNIVLFLLDGMGSNILDRNIEDNSFFKNNKIQNLTSVFPATTTAATTSIRTGLNPVEHGWLGWNMYIKPIDKVVTLYKNKEKESEKKVNVEDFLTLTSIADEINNNTDYSALELFPFPTGNVTVYKKLDDLMDIILNETKKESKHFIYAYNDEPDHTMHLIGPDNEKVKELIKERNDKIEKLYEQLEDTLLIVIADHGHIKVDNLFLDDYPEIKNMLERTTSIEQRAVSFKIKNEYLNYFPEIFNNHLGKWFTLYTKEDIIKSKLFGEGKEHILFNSAIGDYIAIAENSNKTIVTNGDDILVSQHAGYTDDEIYIPLIAIYKK